MTTPEGVVFGEPGVNYRPVPSLPYYYAGDDGSIWTVYSGKPRKRKQTRNAYTRRLYVGTRLGSPALVHRLVLEAFFGPCPLGMVGCHYNDDPDDNRLANLRWDTESANVRDSYRNGRRKGKLRPQGKPPKDRKPGPQRNGK